MRKPKECDCCTFKTKTLKWYQSSRLPFSKNAGKWLCDLCANTMTGTYIDFPEQNRGPEIAIMKCVCYVGNAILQEIRNGNDTPRSRTSPS